MFNVGWNRDISDMFDAWSSDVCEKSLSVLVPGHKQKQK